MINGNLNIGSVAELNKVLSNFPEIDANKWVKSPELLYKEIKENDCRLSIEKGELLRRVDVIRVKCFYTNPEGERFQLVEEKQVFKNGKVRNRGFNFVGEKLKEGEDPKLGALRGLAEELKIAGPNVQVKSLEEENTSVTLESPTYLGIKSNYRTYNFAYEVPEEEFKPSYVEIDEGSKDTYFSWVKI